MAEQEIEIQLDEDILIEATEYQIGVVSDDRMQIRFVNDDGILSTFTTDSAGAYEFAHRVLRGYDKLEGL
jgi:hypothetical protein